MVLIYALRRGNPKDKSRRELENRSRMLLSQLDEENCSIVVPTVCVAELLVGVEPRNRGKFVAEIARRFVCPTLDLHAASIAADLWAAHRKLPETKQIKRLILKADVLIIATAKSAGATSFYSHDAKCRRLAKKAGLLAYDLPTHHSNMFLDKKFREE